MKEYQLLSCMKGDTLKVETEKPENITNKGMEPSQNH